ncbi:MAG TPA: helix-turn-helix transcriptional regulator [Acidimicrobiales bacterium]|nr:helix-turn-helix transcriptional regulator [Acidimicrobiales bacterium]
MNAARALLQARRRARLTQRQLAAATGVSQPTIARIERGLETPRVDTLDRLLRACGDALEAVPLAGVGVDRSVINGLLHLSPAERIELSTQEAETLSSFDQAVGRGSE